MQLLSFLLNLILISFIFPAPFMTNILCTRLTIRLIGLRPLNKLREHDTLRALSRLRTHTQPAEELTWSQPITQPVMELKGTLSHLVYCLFLLYFFLYFYFHVFFFLFSSNLLNSSNSSLPQGVTLVVC